MIPVAPLKQVTASAEITGNGPASMRTLPKPVQDPDRFYEIAKRHGFFKYVVLDIHGKKNGRLCPKVLGTNLDRSFFDSSNQVRETADSPLIDGLTKTNIPYGWRLAFDCGTGRQRIPSTPIDDRLIELFGEHHIRGGFCVPIYSLGGRRHAVIYYAEHLDASDRHPELVLETIECFERTFVESDFAKAEPIKQLNAGERRCLLWAARGKTSHEISIILELSEHTVNHYFTSSAQKLRASGRIQAVVKAIDAGVIDLHGE